MTVTTRARRVARAHRRTVVAQQDNNNDIPAKNLEKRKKIKKELNR
jgi:GTP-dependent phosphoenolpyruvate carboxykinase